MESVELNNVTDTIESEAEPSNIEEESENSVTDIMNLDIMSRLSLATNDTYEEPRTNGMPRQGHFNEHDEAKTLSPETDDSNIQYVSYTSELQMPDIMHLIQKDLSEPYSIYTYRYFIHNWPKLCFLAMDGDKCIGAIVCKLDIHRKVIKRGYIAMLAVDVKYRKRKVGSNLVRRAIQAMMEDNADEVVLETEITNSPALRLYENLGFEHTEMGERRTKIVCISKYVKKYATLMPERLWIVCAQYISDIL